MTHFGSPNAAIALATMPNALVLKIALYKHFKRPE